MRVVHFQFSEIGVAHQPSGHYAREADIVFDDASRLRMFHTPRAHMARGNYEFQLRMIDSFSVDPWTEKRDELAERIYAIAAEAHALRAELPKLRTVLEDRALAASLDHPRPYPCYALDVAFCAYSRVLDRMLAQTAFDRQDTDPLGMAIAR